jgi:hypothetical protein
MISGSIGGVATALLLCVVLMPQAQAESFNGRELREGIRRGNAQNQQPLRDPREAQRPYFQRQEGREEQPPRPPRLSPEERRQLRRDIKDAGREIYLQRR